MSCKGNLLTFKNMYSQAELSKIIQDGIEAIEYSNNAPRLFDPVRYTLESGGKRVRPTLVLMATNLFADDITPAIAPALGLEIYHNFTLLHDDVMDKAPDRRGRPTVHVKWNDNTAILSGDAMLSMAFEHICKTCDDKLRPILDLFTRTTIEIGEGQQLDMEFETRNDVTEEEYIEMIRLKTSVLLGCALKMGAIIGNAPESDSEILYRFGINIGLAFQLQDDWLDCWGDPKTFGKRIGGDILCDKKTYLRITAERRAQTPECAGMSEQEKIDAIKAFYIETKAEEMCRKKIAYYHNKAMQDLSAISVADERLTLLKALASKLENRNI